MPMLGIMASSITGGLSGPSYESIVTATGTGASATITFSSIPQTYKALQIRAIHKNTNTGNGSVYVDVKINGSSAAVYASHELIGDGSTVTAGGSASATEMQGLMSTLGSTAVLANMNAVTILDIHNYASTTQNKTVRSLSGFEDNVGSYSSMRLGSGLYALTTALTSISFFTGTGSWTTSTTFALYGIKGA